jgi:hypothetical protein
VSFTLKDFADAKKLPVDFLREHGVRNGEDDWNRQCVIFDYHDEAGIKTIKRFRYALTGTDKFLWPTGTKTTLYGLDCLPEARKLGYTVLGEGESDTLTCRYHGFPALGLPGAPGGWNEERDADLFDGINIIYVINEKDGAAGKLRERFEQSKIGERVRVVTLNGFKDPSEMHIADSATFVERFRAELDKAEPLGAAEPVDEPALIWHGDPNDAPLRQELVEGALPKTGVALVAGQWGTYKTFVLLDLSGSVVTGTTFAGRPVKQRGGVLLLAAEGQGELRIRVEALADAKAEAAKATKLDPARLPIVWMEKCPVLTSERAPTELRKIIATAQRDMTKRFDLPLVLVGIDAMTSASAFRDADNTSEAAQVMIMLGELAREFDLLIVVIDHFGKDPTTGTRNSSAKEDIADAVLALLGEKSIEGVVSNPRMALRKTRGGATGKVTPFRMIEIEIEGASTLAVAWGTREEGLTAKKAREWPQSLKVFKRTLDICLCDHGQRLRPFPDGPEVLAVKRSIVRDEFLRSYSADTQDAKEKAFERSEKRAQADELICARAVGSSQEMFFWWPSAKQ